MKRILVIQPLRPEGLEIFDARKDVAYKVVTDSSEKNLLVNAADADAIAVRTAVITKRVLDAAPRLKVISRHGVGYDNIPVSACTARGIAVTVVGGVNAISVAEHTWFLILAAARSGVELDTATRRGDFGIRERVTGLELSGRNLLIIGFGRVGKQVAARARAFGMNISVFDPYLQGELPKDVRLFASLEGALREADVVTLHTPLTDETRALLCERELWLLPKGAILVNASRGGVVDEAALLAAVRSGHLHGAGLDTFEMEPLPSDSPLLSEPRIVLSPHAAAMTETSLVAMSVMTAKNALAGLDGTLDPELVVNPSVLKMAP
ncbi:MAG: hydroxyacid dehydrogenase [Verrucomicrobia bacterium]|nr:hydroxyacid dehydrogenase [Verrucomicrobiota bacterium]MBV8278740.1 hydroxyacid dehydrogenase [Verrucomicrobiota bacterium]